MLFSKESVLTGVPLRPRIRCALLFVDVARPLARRRSVHHPTIAFKATAQIPHIAGGSYGDEFRPD
jgi:hypothetical protein